MKDRAGLQERIEAQRKAQRQERLRLMRRVAEVLQKGKKAQKNRSDSLELHRL
ncbi:hypothetical protein [Rhodobium gokarnense]|uniref:Uncharacterized protein n=1 Tax=Rhodobium gokarnense TaxID=364296 RepID=A0ABT3HF59_9HYPH|nr:hypothetical protein [Rhodobium gokarnense]MCW2308959.1 hypothetical protein [Rhodobium gokarnense]